MERTKADAIAQALLQPDAKQQEERAKRQQRREIAARYQLQKRWVAASALVGCAIGALVAIWLDMRFSVGVLLGGLVSANVGWWFVALRMRDRPR